MDAPKHDPQALLVSMIDHRDRVLTVNIAMAKALELAKQDLADVKAEIRWKQSLLDESAKAAADADSW